MEETRWDEAIASFVSLNLAGHIVNCNQTFSDFVKYTKSELNGAHIEHVLNNAGRFFFHSLVYPKLRAVGQVEDIYITLETKESQLKDCLFSAKLFNENDQAVIDCIIFPVSRQIKYEKELKEINKRLEEVLKEKEALHTTLIEKQQQLLTLNKELKLYATRDSLTKLYNRRVFLDRLEQAIHRFNRTGESFSLMLLDIDYFKRVNDQYGHSVGDDVLIHLAHTMVYHQDMSFTSARFGGEEFVVLMPDLTEKAATEAAELLRELVEKAQFFSVPITISIGVSTFTSSDDSDTLILKADKAMYKAKQSGRNKVVHYNEIKNDTN
ncbi:hypothetical protein GCM10012290_25820 [Halolactibacillus alkaliphilus]|uniref:GGDEF domain-containing protein n=1 Tax=Halolactibacillus alkaliphilus TaxID=442899 RepID=A0A511X502_9BACI|nr:GGDEF domain-containing protein [Halolactibacillus alkaliphilus]GEN58032.1 hypothetical protein HAL01_24960 [Halolactibacillus alkaliphilus]GGN76260.1 hypothetical protein GCM10012290_25820 [Halolactibacillus alkaliphilus]SFP11990.1 diguanylate cyclase (GGDEF) domain-containing protein [Halolactibacillus alkaliphilus]